MKARFIDGYLVDLAADPASQFHPDLAAEFIDLPAGALEVVAPGWRFDGEGWTAPPPRAPEPVPEPQPRELTYVEFVTLALQAGGMTPAGYAAALASPDLILYLDLLKQAKGIRMEDPMMALGSAAFIDKGLITAPGWAAMMAAWPRV